MIKTCLLEMSNTISNTYLRISQKKHLFLRWESIFHDMTEKNSITNSDKSNTSIKTTKTYQIKDVAIESISFFQKAAGKTNKSYKEFFESDIQEFCMDILKKSGSKPARQEDLETLMDEKFKILSDQFKKMTDSQSERVGDQKKLLEQITNLTEENKNLKQTNIELKNLLEEIQKSVSSIEGIKETVSSIKNEQSRSIFSKLFKS